MASDIISLRARQDLTASCQRAPQPSLDVAVNDVIYKVPYFTFPYVLSSGGLLPVV